MAVRHLPLAPATAAEVRQVLETASEAVGLGVGRVSQTMPALRSTGGSRGEGDETDLVAVPPDGSRAGPRDDGMEPLLQVGDLARAVGKSVRAIHLYEELGILKPHARSKGRFRLFGQDALTRVRWIAKLQDLGLTLGEIQGIVREWEQQPSAPGAMRQMRDTYRARLAETRAQIIRLQALEAELAASLHYLDTCDTCDPARLLAACVSCDLHSCDQHVPDLVAGFHAGTTASNPGNPGAASPSDAALGLPPDRGSGRFHTSSTQAPKAQRSSQPGEADLVATSHRDSDATLAIPTDR